MENIPTTTKIYTTYAEDSDMTFILKDCTEIKNGKLTLISTEVVGFYYGESDEEATKRYIGKLKAEC